MTNKVSNLHDFHPFSKPSQVSIANGKNVSVMGKGKLNLMSKNIESSAPYVPSFPFKLLSIRQFTYTLKGTATFSPTNVVFQDCITKKMIGEGFFLNGLYFFFLQVSSS